jgi:Trk-type K+ transport systems, membrane components
VAPAQHGDADPLLPDLWLFRLHLRRHQDRPRHPGGQGHPPESGTDRGAERRQEHPRGRRAKPDSQISDAYGYIFCYLLVVVVFAAVNIAVGIDFTTSVTASIACIGNVGPGFGDVGSMSNYAAFPGILKFTSMLEMLIGRLEIFPVLYLFRSFWMTR